VEDYGRPKGTGNRVEKDPDDCPTTRLGTRLATLVEVGAIRVEEAETFHLLVWDWQNLGCRLDALEDAMYQAMNLWRHV